MSCKLTKRFCVCLLIMFVPFVLIVFFFLRSIIDTVLLIKSQNLIANSSSNVESSNNNNNSNYNNNNHRKLFKQQTDDHVTASILSHKTMDYVRRNSYGDISMIFLIFSFQSFHLTKKNRHIIHNFQIYKITTQTRQSLAKYQNKILFHSVMIINTKYKSF